MEKRNQKTNRNICNSRLCLVALLATSFGISATEDSLGNQAVNADKALTQESSAQPGRAEVKRAGHSQRLAQAAPEEATVLPEMTVTASPTDESSRVG